MYHEGEIFIQEKAGERAFAERVSRAIGSEIMPGAVAFIENQEMAIISSADQDQNIWISSLIGASTFISVGDSQHLSFDLTKIISDKDDILYQNLQHKNAAVGTLFIDLGARRRFRLNGHSSIHENKVEIKTEEAYGNCPKYIQRRTFSSPETAEEVQHSKISKGVKLTEEQIELIVQSDTLFVGTESAEGKLDASHRGGPQGFVQVTDNGVLKIPDYIGNNMFNTLGNIYQTKKAGLLFIDFNSGNTLQLTGKAEVLFDQNSETDQAQSMGTERFWHFETEQWIQTNQHHTGQWNFFDFSPFNP